MKLYLVRHGESVTNAADVFGPPDTELSEEGRRQAEMLAARTQKLPVEIIFTSTMKRAEETAAIIGSAVGKEVVPTDLLREIKRPTEIIGAKRRGEKTKRIFEQIAANQNNPQWHYSDEENAFDLKNRVQAFLQLLEQRREGHILCVTHGATLRMLIALMLMGKEVTPDFFYRLWDFLGTRNTGITVCDTRDGTWHLLVWNDHAHLG